MPGLNPSPHSNILVRCELILWVGLQLTPHLLGNYIWSVRMCRALGVVGAKTNFIDPTLKYIHLTNALAGEPYGRSSS